MQCPNCQHTVPDIANVCGNCGYRLRGAQPVPTARPAGMPGWVWGIIGASLTVLILIAAGFFYLSSSTQTAAPPAVLPSPIPSASPTPSPVPTATETLTPVPAAAVQPSRDRCEVFDNIKMKFVTLDWYGGPLTFYLKMPGGVPGLEKKISGDAGPWNYSVELGEYETDNCQVLEGYGERLYCNIELPSTYVYTLKPMTLTVDGCESPIYRDPIAEVPAYAKVAASGGGGGGSSCGAPPADTYSGAYFTWCSCMGGAYISGSGGNFCIIP